MKKEYLWVIIGILLFIVGVLVGNTVIKPTININGNEKIEKNDNNTETHYNKSEKTGEFRDNTTTTTTITTTTQEIKEKTTKTTTTKKENISISYSKKDSEVISELERIDEETTTLLSETKSETIKDKAKGVFISLVDFLFYDGTINGITFDELSDSGKKKVLEIANKLDTKIESKYPDYKETISDKASSAFSKASDIIKKGASNLNDFSKEKLGEENYNKIIDAKDDLVAYTKKAGTIIKDVSSNLWTKTKSALKNWYEKFKTK